jgi:oligopeptidase A
MREILALRQEESRLLGYRNFGKCRWCPRWPSHRSRSLPSCATWPHAAKPFAEKTWPTCALCAEQLGLADPQAWDWPYIGEKLKEARYAFSEQEVKQYFTGAQGAGGLFKIVETLFEVIDPPDQHAGVAPVGAFYRIERHARAPRATELVGQFYLDPTARAGKRGGAWMDDVRARWLRPDTGTADARGASGVQLRRRRGRQAGPADPRRRDHAVPRVRPRPAPHADPGERARCVGISGVEWDAVELPSQFMENFCWEWNVLRHMTAHVDTGAPLPRALFDKMLAAKQLPERHADPAPDRIRAVRHAAAHRARPGAGLHALLHQVRAEVAVIQPPAWSRTAHTFSHIFAGGYAAGYYSYKWAEVLSADAYAAFEETG